MICPTCSKEFKNETGYEIHLHFHKIGHLKSDGKINPNYKNNSKKLKKSADSKKKENLFKLAKAVGRMYNSNTKKQFDLAKRLAFKEYELFCSWR